MSYNDNFMKKYCLLLISISVGCFFNLLGQEVNVKAFDLLDLNRKELGQVKESYLHNDFEGAAQALLQYFRQRSGVENPEVDLTNLRISADDQKMADEALEHRFFSHKGYQPSFFYGDDINWAYWPVVDNELRWQLHRHKWWVPMGKAYRVKKDERYAKEWTSQYLDWIKKNPLLKKGDSFASKEEEKQQLQNVRYAWRPLEVSHRIQDQTGQFLLFKDSEFFTAAFLTQFLVNYHRHCQHILENYSDKGNHLLFEAQRMIHAGAFFPEFKDAVTWRKSGIDILNKEIDVQVYSDGMQFELDPHYHLAAINIFYKALRMADANGFRSEFPKHYLDVVEKMIEAQYNLSFPNYTNPMFSDAKLHDEDEMVRNYREWLKVFPDNEVIRYYASKGTEGQLPSYLSHALLKSGFFVFRSGWDTKATVMMLKAGPPAFWHNQPDNGTFELMVAGRNFFPDAGSYVYQGDAEVNKQRDWFRQTMVHKTLTLDGQNLDSTDSKCMLWVPEGTIQKLVVENPSYKGLQHRRSVFFIDNRYFVIVDEAKGPAKGKVALHYQMCEGEVLTDEVLNMAKTTFADQNNIKLQCFASKSKMVDEEGWVSYAYRQKSRRKAFAFEVDKIGSETVRYVTVIAPFADPASEPKIKAKMNRVSDQGMDLWVTINKKKYRLTYQLN